MKRSARENVAQPGPKLSLQLSAAQTMQRRLCEMADSITYRFWSQLLWGFMYRKVDRVVRFETGKICGKDCSNARETCAHPVGCACWSCEFQQPMPRKRQSGLKSLVLQSNGRGSLRLYGLHSGNLGQSCHTAVTCYFQSNYRFHEVRVVAQLWLKSRIWYHIWQHCTTGCTLSNTNLHTNNVTWDLIKYIDATKFVQALSLV